MMTRLKLWLLVFGVASLPLLGCWVIGYRGTGGRTAPAFARPDAKGTTRVGLSTPLRVVLSDGAPARDLKVEIRKAPPFSNVSIDRAHQVPNGPCVRVLETDANGFVDVGAVGAGWWNASAWHGSTFGQAVVYVLERPPGSWFREYRPQLALEDLRIVEIETVDPSGSPAADICVALFSPDDRTHQPCAESDPGHHLYTVIDGRTGDDGRVQFAIRPTHGGFGATPRIGALARLFGRTEPVAATTTWSRRRARLRLELPEINAMRIRVDHPRPVEVFWGAGVNRVFDRDVHLCFGRAAYRDLGWLNGYTQDWAAYVSREGLRINGFLPRQTVTFETRLWREQRRQLVVSSHEKEQEVLLPTGPRPANVRWRAVTKDGVPVPGREYTVRLRTDWGAVHQVVRGDGAEQAEVPSGSSTVLEFRPWPADSVEPLARIEVPALEPGATHDAGVVTTRRPPLVVAGRVVDEHGKGRSHVGLKLEGGGRLWATTQADGRFEFRGVIDGDDFWLTSMWPIEPVECVRGQVDLVLEKKPTGRIAGRVHVPEHLRHYSVTLEIPNIAPYRYVTRDPGGRFTTRGLAPGTYRVAVKFERDTIHAATVDVLPDQTVRPPSLQAIDVGDLVRLQRVEVRDSQGAPIADAHIALYPAENRTLLPEQAYTDAAGVAELPVHHGGPWRVEVDRPGFHETTLESASSPIVVTLTPDPAWRNYPR